MRPTSPRPSSHWATRFGGRAASSRRATPTARPNKSVEEAGHGPIDLASIHKHIGIVSAALGDLQDAEAHFDKAQALLTPQYSSDHPDVIDIDLHLGDLLRRTGKLDRSQKLLKHVAEVRRARLGAHPDHAGALVKYAIVLREAGQLDKSIELLREAVDMFEQCMGMEHSYVADAKIELGTSLSLTGRPADRSSARAEYADALRIYQKRCGPTHSATMHAAQLVAELDALDED